MTDEDEVLRIETALRAEGWSEQTSLVQQIRVRAQLANEVTTYGLTVDDYTNDLCSRDYLAELITRASCGLRVAVEERVAPSDERFRAATVDDTDGRLGRHFRMDSDDGWWWHRRPATGPLSEHLAAGS